jgi:hypothetical protein
MNDHTPKLADLDLAIVLGDACSANLPRPRRQPAGLIGGQGLFPAKIKWTGAGTGLTAASHFNPYNQTQPRCENRFEHLRRDRKKPRTFGNPENATAIIIITSEAIILPTGPFSSEKALKTGPNTLLNEKTAGRSPGGTRVTGVTGSCRCESCCESCGSLALEQD